MATILIADDEELLRTLASRVLAAAGYNVLTASNGVEAVALYRSFHDRIDAVVTDMKMPVMGGDQAVLLIRRTQPEAKIICMSGYSDEPVPEGVRFLLKPFSPSALRKAVDDLLHVE